MGTMGIAARQLLQARAEAEEKALALQTAQVAEAAKAVSRLEWSDDEEDHRAAARGGKDGFVGRFEAAEELLYDTFTGYPFVENLIVDPGRIWI